MTIQTFTAPLMGAFHRMKDLEKPVPAVGILSVLPSGFPLYLLREPENTSDENAVKVLLSSSDLEEQNIDMDKLEEAINPYGFIVEDIVADEYWHVGYIAKEFAVHLTKLLIPSLVMTDEGEEELEPEYSAHLTFFTNNRGKQQNAVVIEMDIGE
jgi:hypothetical protein